MHVDLEIRHLRLMVEIAERGGLTRAASALNMTQSAASHQLRDAEERLGTPLFRREGRALVRTEAGDRILESARRVLEEMSRAALDARRIAGGTREKLRIATECYTCYYWLGPLMERLSRRFPDVDVEVVVEATHRPVDYLLAGKLDIGIINLPNRFPGLTFEKILVDELVGVVSPTHRLAAKRFLEPKDFAGEPMILYDVDPTQITFLQKFLKPARVTPGRIHHVKLTEAILELVRAGKGVSALARWAVEPQAQRLGLVLRPLGKKGFAREWNAAYRKGTLAPHMREFIDLLATEPMDVRLTGTR